MFVVLVKYMYTHIHTHIQIYTHIYIHIYIHTYIHTCIVTFSGFISSVDICTVLLSRLYICLEPIGPVFQWVLDICKLQLEMAWFVAHR